MIATLWFFYYGVAVDARVDAAGRALTTALGVAIATGDGVNATATPPSGCTLLAIVPPVASS